MAINPNDDPNRTLNRSSTYRGEERSGSMGWLVGALVAVAVLAAIFIFTRGTDNVALNNETATPATMSQSAAPAGARTTGPSTDGSGSNAR
jgi:hypothetical protein